MNAYAGFAGRADEWTINGNERARGIWCATRKKLAREDLSLTHTIIWSDRRFVERQEPCRP